jgi:hypothetical protein
LLLGWAALLLTVWVSLDDFGPLFWKAMIPVGLELAVGTGLLLRRRWGWLMGIATAIFLVLNGLLRVIVAPDHELIVLVAWAIHYFIPAVVLFACLLPARARRVYLEQTHPDVG